jgi:hypothetical protein
MASIDTPDAGLPTNPPTRRLRWGEDTGQQETAEWRGTREDIEAKYDELVALGVGGGGIQAVELTGVQGRCKVVATYATTDDDEVTIIEELYAVDMLKDILNSPYFNDGGAAVLTDNEAVFVRAVSEQGLEDDSTGEGSIDAYVDRRELSASFKWAHWTAAMKELRYHMVHGHESYLETRFILRRSKYGVQTSSINLTFDNINKVVGAPSFSTPMTSLISSLPAGEWMKKPPSASYLGRGRWRTEEEFHWADKWSVIYGGTFKKP